MKRQVSVKDADTATADVGTIEHALNTEHPVRGELIVAADLSASGETTLRKTAVILPESILEAC